MSDPEAIIIACEGRTEVVYLNILKRRFRLPTHVKILPEIKRDKYERLGQHEKLIKKAAEKREELRMELGGQAAIEAWAVCDRDEYKESFTKLRDFADERNVLLAFSDPQFENYLLQHFSQNKSRKVKGDVEKELSDEMLRRDPRFGLYNKTNLDWLDDMIDEKHSVINFAIKNADIFSNHTRQPFFTVQKLVKRLVELV